MSRNDKGNSLFSYVVLGRKFLSKNFENIILTHFLITFFYHTHVTFKKHKPISLFIISFLLVRTRWQGQLDYQSNYSGTQTKKIKILFVQKISRLVQLICKERRAFRPSFRFTVSQKLFSKTLLAKLFPNVSRMQSCIINNSRQIPCFHYS